MKFIRYIHITMGMMRRSSFRRTLLSVSLSTGSREEPSSISVPAWALAAFFSLSESEDVMFALLKVFLPNPSAQ